MTITIPDEILLATRMTTEEMAVEVAVILYDHGKVPLESAAEVARMRPRQFAHLLASRELHVDSRYFGNLATVPVT